MQYSLNNHDQNSVYGVTSYKALQTIGFVQAVYSKKILNHDLLFGTTYRHTIYDDNTPATLQKEKTNTYDVYVNINEESSIDNIEEKFERVTDVIEKILKFK